MSEVKKPQYEIIINNEPNCLPKGFKDLGSKYFQSQNYYKKPNILTIDKAPKDATRNSRIGETLKVNYVRLVPKADVVDGDIGRENADNTKLPVDDDSLIAELTQFFSEMSDDCYRSRFSSARGSKDQVETMVKAMLANLKGIIFLYDNKDKIVGMANYSRDDIMKNADGDPTVEVSYVITDAEGDYQGYGVGYKLLSILIRYILNEDSSVWCVYANFSSGNDRSRRMFIDVVASLGLADRLIQEDLQNFFLDVRPFLFTDEEIKQYQQPNADGGEAGPETVGGVFAIAVGALSNLVHNDS